MIQAFDTETTGLPLWREPSIAPQQPHIVQLAFLLVNDAGEEVERYCQIIRPDGWSIPAETAAIHGITHEKAMDIGIPFAQAMEAYLAARKKAVLRVAHNVSFDDRIMRIAMLRHGLTREQVEAMEAEPKFCTMIAAGRHLKLPPTEKMMAAGFTKPKPPRLSECMQHFFEEDLAGAHDALIDVSACLRLYFKLLEMESAADQPVAAVA